MLRRLTLALVLAVLALTAACAPSPEQVKQILRENPDLLMEILEEHKVRLVEIVQDGLRERQALEEEERLQSELKDPLVPRIDPQRAVFGDPGAPVTVVEYSDFLCPHCSRADRTMTAIMESRDDVRLVFKHLPQHEASLHAALVFEALSRQDRNAAWALKKIFFAEQAALDKGGTNYLRQAVIRVGADPELVDRAIADEALMDTLAADMAEADAFGFTGTPMFLVNGVSIRGAADTEEFERVINLVLERDGEDCDVCGDTGEDGG